MCVSSSSKCLLSLLFLDLQVRSFQLVQLLNAPVLCGNVLGKTPAVAAPVRILAALAFGSAATQPVPLAALSNRPGLQQRIQWLDTYAVAATSGGNTHNSFPKEQSAKANHA